MNARQFPKYGEKRDYRKIDIFCAHAPSLREYACSTTWARTCREARERFCEAKGIPLDMVRARFARNA